MAWYVVLLRTKQTYCYCNIGGKIVRMIKAVLHFSRIVAKRCVFHRFVKTNAELMIWTHDRVCYILLRYG